MPAWILRVNQNMIGSLPASSNGTQKTSEFPSRSSLLYCISELRNHISWVLRAENRRARHDDICACVSCLIYRSYRQPAINLDVQLWVLFPESGHFG
jgi:hypothetical protein